MTYRLVIGAIAGIGLIVWGTGIRQDMIIASPLLPVDFIHADHIDAGCIECHHNFNDDTGQGTCFNCHKTDPEVAADIQSMFHDFCRGCHLEKAVAGEDGGPVRVCGQCHRPNDAFM